jgi:1-phosphofructokinase
MIYTLTLNPALDYSVQFESFEKSALNSAKLSYFLAGGKGINVSKVLKNLDKDSIALGFVGGFTGEYIKSELGGEKIEYDFIELSGNTRVNIKLRDEESETEIAGNSPEISTEKQEELFKQLSKVKKSDILVLAGSVPKGMTEDFYKKVAEKLEGVKIILDTRGEAFKEGIKAKPFLIKPNIHELEEFLGRTLSGIEEIVEGARELKAHGPQNVIISMGGEGSLFLTDNKVYLGNVPKGELKNSVGAGDSMVAGFVSAIVEGAAIEEAYRNGIACGSATAYSYTLAKKEDILRLLEEVRIEKI